MAALVKAQGMPNLYIEIFDANSSCYRTERNCESMTVLKFRKISTFSFAIFQSHRRIKNKSRYETFRLKLRGEGKSKGLKFSVAANNAIPESRLFFN
jgi:hypothetical protein